MKKFIYTALLSLGLMAGFTACNEKWEPDTQYGSEVGKLSTDGLTIDITNVENIIESRAAVDLSNFIVTVSDKDGVVVNQWTYASMPSLPVFNVGNYTLKVESAKPDKAAWNAPYFVGEKSFTIVKDEITNAGTVTCKLGNLKVSVKFSSELVAASAGDIDCEIRINEEGVLHFTPDETRSGYFDVVPGNTTMVATFTGTINGYREEIIRLYKDLNPGQHRIINFAMKGSDIEIPVESGFIDPTGGLNVDFSVIDEDLNANVTTGGEDVINGNRPGQEDWPSVPDTPNPGEDPGTDPTPPASNAISFTSDYLDLSTGNCNPANEFGKEEDGLKPAVVKIEAINGIDHLYVTIASESLDVTDVGLRNNFDLAEPGDLADALGPDGLQFPIADQVKNQTEVTFDISMFVPLLAMDMFPGRHNFTIEVVDKQGNSKSITLTFLN